MNIKALWLWLTMGHDRWSRMLVMCIDWCCHQIELDIIGLCRLRQKSHCPHGKWQFTSAEAMSTISDWMNAHLHNWHGMILTLAYMHSKHDNPEIVDHWELFTFLSTIFHAWKQKFEQIANAMHFNQKSHSDGESRLYFQAVEFSSFLILDHLWFPLLYGKSQFNPFL